MYNIIFVKHIMPYGRRTATRARMPVRRRGRKPLMVPAAAAVAGPILNAVANQVGRTTVKRAAAYLAGAAAAGTAGTAGLYSYGRNRKHYPTHVSKTSRGSRPTMRGSTEARSTNDTFGRKAHNSVTALARLAVPTRVLRYGGARKVDLVGAPGTNNSAGLTGGTAITAPASNFPGWFIMRYASHTVGTGQSSAFPYYVLDLNATNNTSVSRCLQYMWLTTNGMPAFYKATGDDMAVAPAEQADAAGWFLESASDNFGTDTPNRSYFSPQWYDCRLQLFGATASQTKWFIEYVQITDDHFDPSWTSNEVISGTGVTSRELRERCAWYQNQVRSLINSPLSDPLKRSKQEGWKVLKRWSYSIAPHMDTETDTTPNSVTAKLFIHDGRLLRYRPFEADAGLTEVPDLLDQPLDVVQDIASVNTRLNVPASSKQKRFLIIRCSNSINTYLSAASQTDTPSFNLLVRKKEHASEH